MSDFKIYQKINSENDLSYAISRLEDIYEKRNGRIDEPHRHNFYTILVVKHAKGMHKIDFNTYDFADNQIYFVSPGQVHQVIETEKSFGFVFTFSNEFLIKNSISTEFVEELNLFTHYGQSPPLLPSEKQFARIENFAEESYVLFTENYNLKELSLGAFLKLLLIECKNICSIHPGENRNENAGNTIFRNFKKSVESYYKKEHATGFYADKLNITSDHLNRVVKNKMGKTAKDYLQSRILTEAKRMLYFTDLSNKEIGYELGFNEPANFSAFFKKCSQTTPSDFKKLETVS